MSDPTPEKPYTGLWRYDPNAKAPEGKYLLLRRDGSVVEWPHFPIGAKDPAASAGLRAYADKAEELGFFPQYVADVRRLADEFDAYLAEHGPGDPDRGPHRTDNVEIVAMMRRGRAA